MALARNTKISLAALLVGLCVSACSSIQTSTPADVSSPDAANNAPKRMTPVVEDRPARMFVWAGFDEKHCTAITPKFSVSQQPSKGNVTFKPNQTTTIKQSNSGKCIGTQLPGTGIYYTAQKGQRGTDQFTIQATTGSGHTATRSFQVEIVE